MLGLVYRFFGVLAIGYTVIQIFGQVENADNMHAITYYVDQPTTVSRSTTRTSYDTQDNSNDVVRYKARTTNNTTSLNREPLNNTTVTQRRETTASRTLDTDTLIEQVYAGQKLSMDTTTARDLLRETCDTHEEICDKISFQGDFTTQEEAINVIITTHIISRMNRNLRSGKDLTDELLYVKISDEQICTKQARGCASSNYINIDRSQISSDYEFLQVLTHELSHIVDLSVLQGESSRLSYGYTEFGRIKFSVDDPSIDYYSISWEDESTKTNSTEKTDFCSGYGRSNYFEDFAECSNLYLNHYETFVNMAQTSRILAEKLAFFEDLYRSPLNDGSSPAYALNRPWDTTKL